MSPSARKTPLGIPVTGYGASRRFPFSATAAPRSTITTLSILPKHAAISRSGGGLRNRTPEVWASVGKLLLSHRIPRSALAETKPSDSFDGRSIARGA
jgi:hypothetical protein